MPYLDGQFDTAVTMFGAMFTYRPDRAAAELLRVTRSGGRVAMANWTPEGFVGEMLRAHTAVVPPPSGLPSPLEWGREGRVRARFGERATSVTCARRTLELRFPFPPAAVTELFATCYGPTVATLRATDPAGASRLRVELTRLFQQHNRAADGTTAVSANISTSRRASPDGQPFPSAAVGRLPHPRERYVMSQRSNALAERLEQGANALAALAGELTNAEWQARIPKDGRKVGVVVHHVATMYPLEIQLAQVLAGGQPVVGVTWDDVHAMNAGHAEEHDAVDEGSGPGTAPPEQRGGRGRHPGAERRAARPGRAALAQRGCPAHVPVHARGSRRSAQLSPPRRHPAGAEGAAAAGRRIGASDGSSRRERYGPEIDPNGVRRPRPAHAMAETARAGRDTAG